MEVHTIKIEPVDIETHIKDAVVKSAVGETLSKVIREKLNGWEFEKSIKEIVDKIIPAIIRDIILEDGYKQKMAQAVREALTDDLVMRIANKSIEQLWK